MKNFFVVVTCTLIMTSPVLSFASPDDRQDRRQERGRSDERQDRRDCRREEGIVGEDKRECKMVSEATRARGSTGTTMKRMTSIYKARL
jgi:hypothetical protein